MSKIKPNYTKCIVIVHGWSEKQICEYIKTNLRFPMEIVSEAKGKNSIQINDLQNLFTKDHRFKNKSNLLNHFSGIEIVTENKKKQIAPYFKIFIIVDTDDCTKEQKNKYISKELFRKYWLHDYIVPIYNTPDLENVLTKAGIKFTKKGNERKKEYIKIFPTSPKYKNSESVELNEFEKNLEKINETNMNEFIKFCLTNRLIQ